MGGEQKVNGDNLDDGTLYLVISELAVNGSIDVRTTLFWSFTSVLSTNVKS